MGTTCGCDNRGGDKDNLHVTAGRKDNTSLDDEEHARVIRKYAPFVKAIMKIQAHWRGYQVRTKGLRQFRDMSGRETGGNLVELRERDTLPEMTNLVTKNLEE